MTSEPPLPPLPPLPAVDALPEPKRVSKKAGKAERKRVLTGLTCASCGGSVEVQEGLTNVRCRYCDTPVAVVGDRGVVRLMVLDTIDRHGAGEAVRQWLRKGIRKDPALKREARAQETFIAWFPFVRIRLDVVGWVLGFIEKRRKRGKSWVTVKEPVERQIERFVDLTMAAAEMAEFGVHRVDLKGDEILPLDEEVLRARGMVFSPKRTPGEVAEILRARALSEIQRANRLDSITFSWLAPIRRRVAVVYYPLWVVRYAFRGRTYQVLVEGPSKKDPAYLTGRTRGSHLIHFPGGAELHGELVEVRVKEFSPVSMRGEIAG